MLVIGQWNRTVKGTVHISDACVSGQNASQACAVVLHFTELNVDIFMKIYKQCLFSFSNFVIVLIY